MNDYSILHAIQIERVFPRLNTIVTYLRNSMIQPRLSALYILSIDNSIAHSLDNCALFKYLSHKKSRKPQFENVWVFLICYTFQHFFVYP